MKGPLRDPMDVVFAVLGAFEVAVLAFAFSGIVAML